MTQKEALTILKTGANVFLTGEPGSGKTHTVNEYTAYLRSCGIEPAITASTGIAATHIGGMTIHSWSGIGARDHLTPYDLDAIATNNRIVKRLTIATVLIIDEISMLSSRMLTATDAVCRTVRKRREPFGGLQIILVGDFFQLPPVVKRAPDDMNQIDLFEEEQQVFAFGSGAWKAANPIVCYLHEQHRQEDVRFVEFLSAIRSGAIKEKHKVLLRTRYKKAPQHHKVTQLYTRNASVDYINSGALKELPGSPTVFTMDSRGADHIVATLKRGCLSPETLSLKVGARVMFTKNDIMFKFVNGTTGVVEAFDRDTGYPQVRTIAGTRITAEPMEWTMQDDGRVLAAVTQIPLRLAWAITIHKSQGMSLTEAHLDLSDCFEYGQGYVALSRLRQLTGLTLSGLNDRALEVHPQIKEQDEQFREISHTACERFAEIDENDLQKMYGNFVRACGGKEGSGRVKRHKEKRIPTHEETYALIISGSLLEEAAEKRGITVGTIINHLEKLIQLKKLSPQDIAHIRPAYADVVCPILVAEKEKTGEMRLTPVRNKLNDTYTFDEIRIARLFVEE